MSAKAVNNHGFEGTPSDFTEEEYLRNFGPMEVLPAGFNPDARFKWILTVDGFDIEVTRYVVLRSPGLKFGGMAMGLIRNHVTDGTYMGTGWREHGGGGVGGALWSKVTDKSGTKHLVIHSIKQIRERMTEANVVIGDKRFVTPRVERAPFRGFIDTEKMAASMAWAQEAAQEVGLKTSAIKQMVMVELGSWNMNSAIIISHGPQEGLTVTGAEIDSANLVETEPGVWKFNTEMLDDEQKQSLAQVGESEKTLDSGFVSIQQLLEESRDVTAPMVVGLILNHLFSTGQATLVLN